MLKQLLIVLTLACNAGTYLPGETLRPPPELPELDESLYTVIDCDGGTLTGTVTLDESYTILQNCHVDGRIVALGIAAQGKSAVLLARSYDTDYVEWIRAESADHIVIRDVTIGTHDGWPIYVKPGVTDVRIERVHVRSDSNKGGIYLDAQSSRTIITRSSLDLTGSGREAIAIDASDYNHITNNHISTDHAGIRIYRNCGEFGVRRQTNPSHNVVAHNTMHTNGAAIELGSRGDAGIVPGYCTDPDTRDHANHNTVYGNEITSAGRGVVDNGHDNHVSL